MIKVFFSLFLFVAVWGWSGGMGPQAMATSHGDWRETVWIPRQNLAQGSWLEVASPVLPWEIELAGENGHLTRPVPMVKLPDLELIVWKPAGTRTITVVGAAQSVRIRAISALPPADRRPRLVLSPQSTGLELPPWTDPPGTTTALVVLKSGPDPWTAELSSRDRQIRVNLPRETREWAFAPRVWGLVPTSIQLQGTDYTQIRFRSIAKTEAIPSDPEAFLSAPPSSWRRPDAEWYQWQGTSVLALISSTYEIQARYLKRLAFFVEKAGFRGRLVTDQQVANLHGWNAHDYAPSDLARFFTLAATSRFELHPEELELRDRLVRAGILIQDGSAAWAPGRGALVGVSAESPPSLRRFLFVHEGFHGLYYSSQRFRDGVLTIWKSMPEEARAAFRAFLARSRYDSSDEPLMMNEFQAYALQQSAEFRKEFFESRVAAGRQAPALIEAAQQVDQLVHDLYGLSAGMVSLVSESRP